MPHSETKYAAGVMPTAQDFEQDSVEKVIADMRKYPGLVAFADRIEALERER